jgi:hypothetical protein
VVVVGDHGPQHRVYYSGDSGYGTHLEEIGTRYGPFDLALVKIGASDPTWIQIHMDPEQAVQASRDLHAAVMQGVHWGTFNLAYHDWFEPADRAAARAARDGVSLVLPRPGQLVEPRHAPPLVCVVARGYARAMIALLSSSWPARTRMRRRAVPNGNGRRRAGDGADSVHGRADSALRCPSAP